MGKLEHKGVEFKSTTVERSDNGVLNIKAYASVFGNVDSYNDIVDKGAFAKTIVEDRARIKACTNHNIYNVYDVIGVINELKEDEKGLYVDVDILPTVNGKDLSILIENGAITELSIGYITKNSYTEVVNGVEYRHITEVELFEFSFIPRASNEKATILSAQRKSEEFISGIKTINDEELTELKNNIDKEYNERVINNLKTN